MKRNEVTNLVDDYLELAELLSFSASDSESISTATDRLPEDTRRRRPRKTKERVSIASVFQAIRANPHEVLRSHIISETFTYALEKYDLDDRERASIGAINETEESLRDFISDVIISALDLNSYIKGASIGTTERTRFIVGDKGVGKTHLQNFIVTHFRRDFDDNDVIWIRINLIRNFGNTHTSLVDWIKAQILKIVGRYYDLESDYLTDKQNEKHIINIKQVLQSYIENNSDESTLDRTRLNEKLRILLQRIRKPHSDQDISPSWIPTEFADEVFRKITESGVCFVVAIDGLDILSLSRTARKKYENRLSSLRDYLNQEALFPIFNLVFARPESLKDLESVFEDSAIPYQQEIDQPYLVTSCDTRLMVQKRLALLASADNPLDIEIERVSEFEEFVVTKKDGFSAESESFVDFVARTAGTNARSVIQTTSMLALTYTGEFETDYHFTEAAMTGNLPYPPTPYRYDSDEDSVLRAWIDDPTALEIIYLPAIGRFPHSSDHPPAITFKKHGRMNYIWSYRLLQVVDDFERTNERRPLVVEVLDVLFTLYGYNQQLTQMIVEEYLESDVLVADASIRGLDARNTDNLVIGLSSKGNHIINYCVFDPTYLAMSAMVCPFPENLVSRGDAGSLIQCGSPQLDPVEQWVFVKLSNSVILYCILETARRRQSEGLSGVDKYSIEVYEKNRLWKPVIQRLLDVNGPYYKLTEIDRDKFEERLLRSIQGTRRDGAEQSIMKRARDVVEQWTLELTTR